MRNTFRVFLAACWLLVSVGAVHAEAPASEEPIVVRGATSLGDEVIPYKFYGDVRDLPLVSPWEFGDGFEINPRRSLGHLGEPWAPQVLDPLVEKQRAYTPRGGGPSITEVHNFEGIDGGNLFPPDPSGDIGKNYYITAINASTFSIYDKVTGNLVAGPTAMDSLGSGVCAAGRGDPIIVYDQFAERWIMSEFEFGNSGLCVYVSMTDDPVSGGWCEYQFVPSRFPDYFKIGIWTDAYTVSANYASAGQPPPVYALDRENMMSCGTARPLQEIAGPFLSGLGFQAFTPADIDGSTLPPAGTPSLHMRHRDTELGNQGPSLPTEDILELWELDVDWDTPANTTFTKLPDIITTEFDSNLCPPIGVFSCIPQPGTSNRLDPLLEVIMYRLTYRNFGAYESILGVLQTDVGDFADHSGERWFEVRRSGGGAWALHQEGTYSPDADHRFMGAITQDGSGNVLLAYTVSSGTTSPSVRYTGREAGDPMGVMTLPEQTLVAGTGNFFGSRWGDYSQMGIDPEDDCTFWFVVEHTEGTNNNTQRIGAVRFDSCGGPAIFLDSFEAGDLLAWSNVIVD
ncbi:MAG: hypothetical protein AAGN66_13225 [Acidobacteriota bacterium]